MSNAETTSLPPVRVDRLVRQSPIFYGWIIMLAGSLGMIMTSPGQTYAVSIFIEHLIVDLGISRSLVSTLYTVGTLVGSFALPLIGRQIDRRGPRTMVTIISLLFGLACIYMGFIQNALMLGLGFVAIRMLGQGSLSIVSTNVINQWWVRRRGAILGISGVLVSLLGLGGFPSLINGLIPHLGWRTTYMLLGLLLLVVMLPLGQFLFRDKPEDYGLQPDGRPARRPIRRNVTPAGEERTAEETTEAAETPEEDWTVQEAMRTPVFWVLALGLAAFSMLGTGLFFHIVSIFADNGLSASTAAAAFVPIAVTTALVNLSSGFLVDRIPVRFLLAVALVSLSGALLLAQHLRGIELAFLYGVLLGTTSGLVRTVSTVAWADYFGRRHLGSITGVTSTLLTGSSALGPMPFGFARDLMGSYNTILTISAVIPLILAVANLFFDRPQKTTT